MSWSSTLPDSFSARRFWQSSLGFLASSGLVYAACIVAATLTLHAYFAQTWDVATFIQAGRALLDGNPFDLYAQSRAAQHWPYAYPPLHAIVSALALVAGDALRVFPESVWVRVPPMLADIGVAVVLYRIIERKSDVATARVAALVWLFNPITFYDTAVQGHFESEWLLCVLLAYLWFQDSRVVMASVALAIAVLFKQIAILFAIPMWIFVLVGATHPSPLPQRVTRLALSGIVFAIIVGAICLPYLLYSDDFWYMNLTYVENVPVQTQSWIVALLGWTRDKPNALTSDFFLLRYQTIISLLAAGVLAWVAARRGWSVYLAATLIAIAFFLTSRKVMGYYYVTLFPFLLAELAPKRRFDLMLIAVAATTYISLSPYYAAWVDHAHWWIYAILGTLNSLFFVWLCFALIADGRRQTADKFAVGGQRSAVVMTLGLFAGAVGAALLQPLAQNNTSPIRAPIIAPGMETTAAFAFVALIAFVVVVLAMIAYTTRGAERISCVAWGIALIFAPLFFAVYYLTKETTAIFEIALKALGV